MLNVSDLTSLFKLCSIILKTQGMREREEGRRESEEESSEIH
jgi:hypothetical protein